MNTNTDLSGFIDLGPEALHRIEGLKAKALSTFAAYGYARIAPPIVETADAVLELSGEDIRRRMYFFDDPSGRELCLRPDLTIPACRMLIRAGWKGERVARLSYAGAVFRHESETGQGRSHQFTQAGVECLGPLDGTLADAEIVALAMDAVTACGLRDSRLRVGDAGLVHSVLSQLPLSRTSRVRLERGTHLTPRSERAGAFAVAQGLEKLEREQATELVAEVMRAAGIRPVGERSLEEIVERLIENGGPVDELDEAREAAECLLMVQAPPDQALATIETFLKDWKLDGRKRLDALSNSFGLMEKLGVDLRRVTFAAGLKRHIDYYTGLVFEIAKAKARNEGVVCGGGRYDRLLSVLAPGLSAPAAGFAISLEMMAVALEGERALSSSIIDEPVDAEVVADGREVARAAEAARALRCGGWRVRLVGPDDDRDARFLVELSGPKGVTILEPREKTRVSLKDSQLTAFAEAHPCR